MPITLYIWDRESNIHLTQKPLYDKLICLDTTDDMFIYNLFDLYLDMHISNNLTRDFIRSH